MSADNLGGYRTSAGGGDGVLQKINLPDSTFATAGGIPSEGYIYVSGTGSPTVAYKFVPTADGRPNFVFAGGTADISNNNRGVGHTMTSSLKGQQGTGLLWITDTQNGNLRVYPAVPPTDGSPWNHIFVGSVPGGAKYQRTVPGNGRVYVNSQNGYVTCFGSPVNQPLNCTQSLNFGDVVVGASSTKTVTCTPNIDTKIIGFNISDASYSLPNPPPVGTQYKAGGAGFSFDVMWTPKNATHSSTAISILTANTIIGKYTTIVPVGLTGVAVSSNAQLQQYPVNVAFDGVVLRNGTTNTGVTKSISLNNLGLQPLNILDWQIVWQSLEDADETSEAPPTDDPDDADGDGPGAAQQAAAFTASGIPASIPAQSSAAITITFNPTIKGAYGVLFKTHTNGGNGTTILTGSAAGPSSTYLFTQQYDGTIVKNVPYVDFGNVPQGVTSTLTLGIVNVGDSASTIQKSKPPVAGSPIYSSNPTGDLTEGLIILPGKNQTGSILLAAPYTQVNSAPFNVTGTWVLNDDDPGFGGVQFVTLSGRVVSPQVGPLINGTAQFGYLGCYAEGVPGTRLFSTTVYSKNTNDVGACTTAVVGQQVSNFAGVEYGAECYASQSPPPPASKVADGLCGMPCANAASGQFCGAAGYLSVFYDTTKFDPVTNAFTPGNAPPSNKAIIPANNYTYSGCFADNKAGARTLNGSTMNSASMTIEMCTNFCATGGFTLSGTEYAVECYCGNSFNGGAVNATNCNAICKGDKSELCGGASGESSCSLLRNFGAEKTC